MKLRLHPMYNGWSVIEGAEDGSANYISAAGQMLSTLWFARAFPFTGQYTVAYVDTGSTADSDQRYLLYVLGQDGTMSRWLAKPGMDDLVASACGVAYMALRRDLPFAGHVRAAGYASPQVDAYLDCDALVGQRRGERQIRPVRAGRAALRFYLRQHPSGGERHSVGTQRPSAARAAAFTVHAVTGAAYPQPLSHSFVLERDGQSEYVALSTQSCYPIRLEGEF